MECLWIAFCTSLIFVSWATSDEVVLMQTPDCDFCYWSWDKYELFLPGWHHPTGSRNRYTLCDGGTPGQQPNNWLRSRFLPAGDIQRLDVTVKYSITKCADLSFTFCNESFFAYVWESNTSFLVNKIPHPINSFGSYRIFGIINRRQQSNPTVLTIPLEVKSKFIVLGFRDQGGCRTLFSVKVSYTICPRKTLKDSLISLPQTSSPFSITKPIPVNGSCATDSVQAVQGSMSALCESSGEWNTSLLEGRCFCKENMENAGGICKACSRGTYNEGNGLNCTVIASEPRDAVASSVTNISAAISWSPPVAIGTETDVLYDIECQKSCDYYGKTCDDEECHGEVSFLFQMKDLDMTNIRITNLASFVNYTCKISAKNRVSKVAERNHGVKENFALVNLRTNGTAPGKPEVAVHLAEDGNIELSWKLTCKNGIIEGYRVTYFRMDDSSDTKTLITKNKEVQIKSLLSKKTYEFRVFALNNFGTGPPGVKTITIPSFETGPPGVKTITIPSGPGNPPSNSATVIAISVVSGVIILIVLALLGTCIYRQRKAQARLEKRLRDLQAAKDFKSIKAITVN